MKYFTLIALLFTLLNANEIAIVKQVTGKVHVKQAGYSIVIQEGASLNEEMILTTKANSSVTLIFKDNSELDLGPDSILNLKKFIFKPVEKEYAFELFLEEGSMVFESGKIGELSPDDFTLKTPDSTVSIRGTKFFVKAK